MTYAVAGGNVDDSFDVDPTTGGLLVKRSLQYWRTAIYDLWIEARDNGSPSLAAYGNFAVAVTSWNQFSPQFVDVWYNASVLEERLPPVAVVTVSAVDLDLGEAGRVSYSLVTNGDSSLFQIGESTGVITTAAKLNRETNEGYQLVVLAYDHVSLSMCHCFSALHSHFVTCQIWVL
jgi:hypothetical protein